MFKIKTNCCSLFLMASVCSALLADAGKPGVDMGKAKQSGIKVTQQGAGASELEGDKANSWGYARFPDSGAKDVQIKGSFTILQAGKLYSPVASYWPLMYHYLADEPGYDFAIVARAENEGVFYRIQFSTKFNEVSLWKEGEPGTDPQAPSVPSGFFAAVKTNAGIKAGEEHTFSLRVIGNKIEFSLDGKAILAYEDKLLPLENGGWGIGVFNGAKVRISGLESGKTSGEIAVEPLKRPSFHVENWHRAGMSAKVIFDGNEPIACLSQGTAAWLNDVKFKPGYRAQLAWPFLYDNRFRASKWGNVRCENDTVVGEVSSKEEHAKYLDGKSVVTLRYDSKNDLYCYDMDVKVTLKEDNNVSKLFNIAQIYYQNTYAYNPMPTTDESIKVNFEGWSTASSPYRMALVKGAGDVVYRWSVHHYYTSFCKAGQHVGSGWQIWSTVKLDKAPYFILYPEKVVCPMVEIISQGDGDYESTFDSCCAYWDMHFWYKPIKDGKFVTEFKKGETYRERFKITGCPAKEADKLMAVSKPLPCFDMSIERPFYVNGVNRFDKVLNVEDSAGRLVWLGAGTWDKTVGRDDKFSMKMDNGGTMSVFIGYNGSSAEAKKAELSVWVKAGPEWKGKGVRLGIEGRYRFGGNDRQWGEYVVPKVGEWTQVKYEVPFPTVFLVCAYIEVNGQGPLWIDDFEYKKLEH